MQDRPPSRRSVLALGLAATIASKSLAASAASPPPPPPGLAAQLQALARGFDGRVGIAVEDVRSGWVAAYDGSTFYPQQSVSKLWVALTVFREIDRGQLDLADTLTIRREDMSVFHQPIQKLLGPDGTAVVSIDSLLVGAIAQSDNAANDILVRRAGGSGAVRKTIADLRLGAIRCGPEEKVLQSKIAGVTWLPEYSFGQAFWTARDAVPLDERTARLNAYVDDPDDGATPVAMVQGLARLQRGELLSKASTGRFMAILTSTETGPMRLKAGLGPGWAIAHKTGTGQDLGSLSTGYNDVGLLTAPDGRVYAAAVMIAATRRPIPERQALMAEVARAVVAAHDLETQGVPAVPSP
jgi:beta-lactamase class A